MKTLRALALSLLVCSAAVAQNAALLPGPQQFLDSNGFPLSGGLIFTCVAGSSCPGTPLASYTDATAGTPNSNPVVLDAGGYGSIWGGGSPYKIVVQTSAGVTVKTYDNVAAASMGTIGATASKGAFTVNGALSATGALTVGGAATVTGAANVLSLDNIQFADRFTGSDMGAKIAAAIAALPSSGGVVDARGFTGAQTAAATITINKPVQLLIGAVALTLSGNPGINLTAGGVRIEGIGQPIYGVLSAASTTGPSVLISGAAGPLINASVAGTFGLLVKNLELNGANIGTVGVNTTRNGPSGVTIEAIDAHHFTVDGVSVLGGLCDLKRSFIASNAEGVLWGSDGSIDTYTAVTVNTGVGIHVMYGGSRIRAESDFNGGVGIWVDGSLGGHINTAISDCYVDDNGGSNIKISGTSGNRISYVHVSNCFISQAATAVAANGISVSYADGVVLNDNIWLGSELGQQGDTGGIVADHVANLKVNGFDSSYSMQSPFTLTFGSDTRIIGLHALNTGLVSTPTASTYAISIDSNSFRTYVYSSDNQDTRGTGFGRGINNAGSNTTIVGWQDGTSVSSPDTFGTAVYLTTNPFGQMQLSGNVSLFGQTQIGTATGSTLTQIQTVSTTSCTTGAAIGNACFQTMPNFATAFADTAYKVSCMFIPPATGAPYISTVTKTTTNMTVNVVAGSAVAAGGTVECMAIHP